MCLSNKNCTIWCFDGRRKKSAPRTFYFEDYRPDKRVIVATKEQRYFSTVMFNLTISVILFFKPYSECIFER